MKTITVSQDDQGKITVTVDGGQPQEVPDAEGACSIVESELGQPDADETGAKADAQMAQGFQSVRGGGLGA